MFVNALRRAVFSPLLNRTTFITTRYQPCPSRVRSMATTYSSPAVASIDDSRQDAARETILTPLRKAVQEQVSKGSVLLISSTPGLIFVDEITVCCQGDLVRQLKADNRPKLEIQEAVAELKVRKKALEKKEKEVAPKEKVFDRSGLETLLKRRFFYAPAFAIYGGWYLMVCSCIHWLFLVTRCGWIVRLWSNGLCNEIKHAVAVEIPLCFRGGNAGGGLYIINTRSSSSVSVSFCVSATAWRIT